MTQTDLTTASYGAETLPEGIRLEYPLFINSQLGLWIALGDVLAVHSQDDAHGAIRWCLS
jgi:hypothetical protein